MHSLYIFKNINVELRKIKILPKFLILSYLLFKSRITLNKVVPLSPSTQKISKALSFESINSIKKELYFTWVCLYTQQSYFFHLFSSFKMHIYVYILNKVIYTACWLKLQSIKNNTIFPFLTIFSFTFIYIIILGLRELRMLTIHSHPTSKRVSTNSETPIYIIQSWEVF